MKIPPFKEINTTETNLMEYKEKWRSIETQHDIEFPAKPKKVIPTLKGLSLLDAQVIQNWLGYANGLGDVSIASFRYKFIFESSF
mgnify:CR=1 FL=1